MPYTLAANLSRGVFDPQCVWPRAPRGRINSEACSHQPQLAGFKADGSRCDFSDTPGNDADGTPTCKTANDDDAFAGAPKYGDYDGIACFGDKAAAAWVTATPPPGAASPTGTPFGVYFSVLSHN